MVVLHKTDTTSKLGTNTNSGLFCSCKDTNNRKVLEICIYFSIFVDMNFIRNKYDKGLLILMLFSFLVRLLVAALIDLGNDEVYYWTYALYPDWSHFDHPPMVGWFIQLFSLNLLFDSELFIRMSSLIVGTFNLFLIYKIGEQIKDTRTGFIAALLYTSSIYGFVITGIFILPDTPQIFFWLLALKILLKILPEKEINADINRKMFLASLLIGFSVLSKYTGIYVFGGAGLYILIYNRKWFSAWSLYLGAVLILVMQIPVLYWNYSNDFISFTYHGARVDAQQSELNFGYFFNELLGQFAYNNPINFLIVWIAVLAYLFGNKYLKRESFRILLFNAFPLIATFLFVSLFRRTLAHWSSPGYFALLLIGAAWLSEKYKYFVPTILKFAISIMLLAVAVGVAQINYGVLDKYTINRKSELRYGKNEPSLDMYGWGQIRDYLQTQGHQLPKCIVSNKWFPAAHLDYYVANPLNIKLLTIGTLNDTHKYEWITVERGAYEMGMDAIAFSLSNQYVDIPAEYKSYFEEVVPIDTLEILRSGQKVKNVFVYRLNGLKKLPKIEHLSVRE